MAGDRPQLLVSRDLLLGPLYDLAFCPDAPHLLCAGGGNGKVGVWDASDAPSVCAALGLSSRQTPVGGSVAASGMQVRPRARSRAPALVAWMAAHALPSSETAQTRWRAHTIAPRRTHAPVLLPAVARDQLVRV